LDLTRPGWIRLYPINFRALDADDQFKKYEVVTVEAKPARPDPRHESWKPIQGHLRPGTTPRPVAAAAAMA
jgi:hypothetical protein